jgi:nitrous oxidase accessory protein NosD
MSKLILAVCAASALILVGAALGAPVRASTGVVVKIGETRTFTQTVLHPGATVKCTYRGHTLSVAAPTGYEEANGTAWTTGKHRFHLYATAKPGHGFVVTCGLGGSHW